MTRGFYAAGTVARLGTLAIGFLARPIGGLFFGTLGDKLGRKWVLMITIALMGGSSFLIGVLPTADQCYLTLGSGDIVLTGAPGTFTPVKPGDNGEIILGGIGSLSNPIVSR